MNHSVLKTEIGCEGKLLAFGVKPRYLILSSKISTAPLWIQFQELSFKVEKNQFQETLEQSEVARHLQLRLHVQVILT